MEIKNVIKKRDNLSHKYDYGRVLSICGSYGMAGAAILCAKACLRTGVGLLDIAVDKSIYPIVSSNVYEAIYTIYENEQDLYNSLNKADAIVMGCGLSLKAKDIVKYVLDNSKVVSVLDADALNIIAYNNLNYNSHQSIKIITPHTQEMARLIDKSKEYILKNRVKVAKEYAIKNNIIVVLKGYNTIVANSDGDIYINNSGNPGMATGGSGDVLSGIISGLVAQNKDIFKATCAAVYIHGLAGDVCAKKFSMNSMIASDLIEVLHEIFLKIENELINDF